MLNLTHSRRNMYIKTMRYSFLLTKLTNATKCDSAVWAGGAGTGALTLGGAGSPRGLLRERLGGTYENF